MPDTQPYQPGLRAANAAPRCNHLRYNGQQCGCPALNGDTRCRFHVHADPKHFAGLPMVEDAASIQLAVMRILRALEFGSLDTKTAALMLYRFADRQLQPQAPGGVFRRAHCPGRGRARAVPCRGAA